MYSFDKIEFRSLQVVSYKATCRIKIVLKKLKTERNYTINSGGKVESVEVTKSNLLMEFPLLFL